MREIEETHLPGLGVRYEFTTSRGTRIGVVHHRTGRREIVVYDRDDPDTSREVIALDPEDAVAMGEMLGASRVSEHLDRLQKVEGLAIDWLPISSASLFSGRPIGDTQARSRTGTSIVAVIRGEGAIPAPGPDFPLQDDDTLLVVGTPRGIEELSVILRSG